MDFHLSSAQNQLRQDTLAFAKSLPDTLVDRDRASAFDRESWFAIAEHGLLGGFAPEKWGGKSWDTLTRVAVLEAFGEGCRDNGLCLGLSSFAWTILPPLLAAGSEDQLQRYLPKMLAGKCLTADGITEANAGSDAMAMETTAKRHPDGYLLNGEKCHIGFAPIADLALVYAKTDPAAGSWGVSTFLIETDTAGLTRSDNTEKMGLRTLPMGSLTFENCLVSADSRLGEEGIGLSLFNESMEWERSFVLATLVGAMKRQLDECVAFANTRQQFGKPIGANQSVSNRIADMQVRLETCRLLLYRNACLKDHGQSIALEASIAKLAISEAFLNSSLDAIRIHGAKGYLTEYQIERDLRDATGGLIYAGTSDIQRNLIARLSGLRQ